MDTLQSLRLAGKWAACPGRLRPNQVDKNHSVSIQHSMSLKPILDRTCLSFVCYSNWVRTRGLSVCSRLNSANRRPACEVFRGHLWIVTIENNLGYTLPLLSCMTLHAHWSYPTPKVSFQPLNSTFKDITWLRGQINVYDTTLIQFSYITHDGDTRT